MGEAERAEDRAADMSGVVDVESDRAPEKEIDGSIDLEGLGWRRSYDRESIEKFALEVEAERERLLAEIDDAERRLADARLAIAERDAESAQIVATLVSASKREIERIEIEQSKALEAIRLEAEREAVRLLDEAQKAAASIDEALVSMRWRLDAGRLGSVVGSASTDEPSPGSEGSSDD